MLGEGSYVTIGLKIRIAEFSLSLFLLFLHSRFDQEEAGCSRHSHCRGGRGRLRPLKREKLLSVFKGETRAGYKGLTRTLGVI